MPTARYPRIGGLDWWLGAVEGQWEAVLNHQATNPKHQLEGVQLLGSLVALSAGQLGAADEARLRQPDAARRRESPAVRVSNMNPGLIYLWLINRGCPLQWGFITFGGNTPLIMQDSRQNSGKLQDFVEV